MIEITAEVEAVLAREWEYWLSKCDTLERTIGEAFQSVAQL